MAWLNGVQEGCSRPVALVLSEDQEQNQVLNQVGCRYFNSVVGLRLYLKTLLDVGVQTQSV